MKSLLGTNAFSCFNLRFHCHIECFSVYFWSSWSLVPITESSLDNLSFFLRYYSYIFLAWVTVFPRALPKTCFHIARKLKSEGGKLFRSLGRIFTMLIHSSDCHGEASTHKATPIGDHNILKYLLWPWVTNHVAAIHQVKIPSSYLFYNVIPSNFKNFRNLNLKKHSGSHNRPPNQRSSPHSDYSPEYKTVEVARARKTIILHKNIC